MHVCMYVCQIDALTSQTPYIPLQVYALLDSSKKYGYYKVRACMAWHAIEAHPRQL